MKIFKQFLFKKNSMLRKFYLLLTSAQKFEAAQLILLMLITTAFEALGVGMIIPALILLTGDGGINGYPLIGEISSYLHLDTKEKQVIFGTLFVAFVYILKTIFLIFFMKKEMNFIFHVQANVSMRLVKKYLHQDYLDYVQRNSAALVQNAIHEVNLFTRSVLMCGISLVAEILVILGLMTLLFYIEPVGALLVILIVGISSFAFNRATNLKIINFGNQRQEHEIGRVKTLQQCLGALKEVRLYAREDEFLHHYERHNNASANADKMQSFFQALPRIWLELLAVLSLVVLALVIIWQGRPLNELLPTLGVFAASAFRLMPSVNRCINSYQSLRFANPLMDMLYSELVLTNQGFTESSKMGNMVSFKNQINLTQISFKYPTRSDPTFEKLNMKFFFGEMVGIFGESGSGKSTLIDIILGLIKPSNGAVEVDGINISKNSREWHGLLGYVPQSVYLLDDSIRRNIAFGTPDEEINDEFLDRLIKDVQLDDLINSLPLGLDNVVGERGAMLSGGQRQRIGIARALYKNPSLLILDEATSALDTATESEIMSAISAFKGVKTILVVAHRASTLKYCDRLYEVKNRHVTSRNKSFFL
jgi:ABC-type multidrug transport system fused ATPase/permease subunit